MRRFSPRPLCTCRTRRRNANSAGRCGIPRSERDCARHRPRSRRPMYPDRGAMELARTAATAADGSYRIGRSPSFFVEVDVKIVYIGLAGFAGAVSRYAVEGWVSNRVRGAFPWGTFVVNASGCFLLGFVFSVLTERFLPHPALRSAVTIGFIGAYTTFSTFAFETLRLAEDGAMLLAFGNLVASVGVGLIAVYAGIDRK